MNVVEAQIRSTLDAVSNGGGVEVREEWIEQAGEEFKAALRKQFSPQPRDFTLRMSNIGRPLCQLQMQKAGAEESRKPYNHVVRMLIGDAVEAVMRLVLKAADVPVTSDGDKVSLDVDGHEINGESDLDIDGAVYDVKSASPWAFKNKWKKGFEALQQEDDFGYIGQLYGYADAQNKRAGGWVVIDKSSGEICVVSAEASEEHLKEVRERRRRVVKAITEDEPFERCFQPFTETYYGKPTGGKRLPKACTFCSFLGSCWPTARLLPQPGSRAKTPPNHWYVEYPETGDGD